MTGRRIQAHSSNGDWVDHVTKVLSSQAKRIALIWFASGCCLACASTAQISAEKPGEALYLQLGQVGLDPARVYKVRGASLTRSSIQITMDDGTIAFTQDVMGRITGAFFEGDGEILLTPPNEVERKSMGLFTGMAILEERFATAYFRFNDQVADELRPDLRATDESQEFVERWGEAAKTLAKSDAMRLLVTFSRLLPGKGASGAEDATALAATDPAADRYLHARLQGTKLGVFDVFFDSTRVEQIQAGQHRTAANGEMYYDVWTSFSLRQARPVTVDGRTQPSVAEVQKEQIRVRRYTIRTEVTPPKQIHAHARMECEVHKGGERILLFELSRFLEVHRVTLDGQPVEFIHNPALEGTQLSRSGNDIVAVILPEPRTAGSKFALEFDYGGEVLAEAGGGLLYVGARGTWYPNRGMEMADFDLEFRYPQGWTLVATGKPIALAPDQLAQANAEQISHWVSDRPIPLAGFNLGKFRMATTRAGAVSVETYASASVEKDFPQAPITVIETNPSDPTLHPEIVVPNRPSPVQHEATVGEAAARAIQYFSDRFGPYPYSHLALTQIPGRESQGWPGLIFLSSYAFLDQQQREQLHYEPERILLQQLIPAHETAHQWWGDLVAWRSYRDQWYTEGLANYCALMMLQEKDPAGFHSVMEQYRRDLVTKDKNGASPMDAGPVTLGSRLLSSRAPMGYEAISYGRGTWLFHMLRTMLQDAEQQEKPHTHTTEEPFTRALRKVRQRYEGRSMSTQEMMDVFAEDLPPALRYEGRKSLNWFLEGWINGTALPKLELKSVKFTPKDSGVVVSGMIMQHDASKDLVTSVPVYAVLAGKQFVLLGRVFADGEESTFRLSAPAGTHKIVLDPYDTVLTGPK